MLKEKIKNLKALKNIVLGLKARGKKIVFTNGCFDLLHYGHVRYLQEAKKRGDILIVAVNSDASVKRLKGNGRPLVHQADRLRILAAIQSIDYLLLFKEATPLKLIKELKPNVLVKGADWDKNNIVGADIVLRDGGKVVAIKLVKGRSTTKLINKIAKGF